MRTLKDLIDEDSFDVNVIMSDKLRQSAIDDIKEFQTKGYDQKIYRYVIDYIQDKFNIKKEDLESKKKSILEKGAKELGELISWWYKNKKELKKKFNK